MIATDRLRSYRAAMNVIGNAADQECGRWLNNLVENSYQPLRRQEGAILKSWDVEALQKLIAAYAFVHNCFNLIRNLNHRAFFKENHSNASAE